MPRLAPLAAALVVLAVPAPAHAALETIIQDDTALLHSPPEAVASSMEQIQALGIERVRLTANWASLAPQPDSAEAPKFDGSDPAAYEQDRWRSLDTAVREADAHGLRVLIDIGFFAPRWATTENTGERARTNIDRVAFAAFARAVVRRYNGSFVPPAPPAPAPAPASAPPPQDDGPLGGLPPIPTTPRQEEPPAPAAPAAPQPLPAVDRFTLWNEPNHPALFMPQWQGAHPVSPTLYRRMVLAAYPAMKGDRPDATILIGNTSSMAGKRGSGAVAPLEFLRAMACVNRRLRPIHRGACAHFRPVPGDGWSHHPYAYNARPDKQRGRDDVPIANLPKLARTLNRLAAMGRIGRGVRNIHLTEFGYETAKIGDRPEVSEAQQARFLTWAEYLAQKIPTVRTWPQFLLRDQPPAAVRVSHSEARPHGEWYTGLAHADGTPKAAVYSFRLGLFAQRHGARTTLYGRLRLGPDVRRVTVERRRRGGRWRAVVRLNMAGNEDFSRSTRTVKGARYRIRTDGVEPGTPIPAVR